MAFTNSKTFLYNAHLLRTFFEDLDRWRSESSCYGILSNIEDQQYDDLFKGTDADVYIPMWASACKGHGDILIDRTIASVSIKRTDMSPSAWTAIPRTFWANSCVSWNI